MKKLLKNTLLGLGIGCSTMLASLSVNAQVRNEQHASNWARWAYSVEADRNQIIDAPNADCSINQKGDTWYLGGQLDHKVSNRKCTIPTGKELFIQIVGLTDINMPGVCNQARPKKPIEVKTRTLVYLGGTKEVYAQLNGTRLPAKNIIRTQAVGAFRITLPENNILDSKCRNNVPAGVYHPADSSGFYVKIDPLPVGTHTITTHAKRVNKTHVINFTITVEDESSNSAMPTVKVQGASVEQLGQWMNDGQLTSEQLVNFYLKRISDIDKNGPALNSILQVSPEALAIAKSLDAERKASGPRGPLHGIPVLLKASIDTADKLETTAGAVALKGHLAKKDAFMVGKLRQAGAIMLAKTNMTEWANFRTYGYFSGWSTLGGSTKNPYVLDRNTCGSSSGSAVAVSAELAPLSIGTETLGSIVCPAGVNGVVALKPSVGIISREGIIPISYTLDTPGPIAKNVKDAAILLQSMAAIDSNDVIGKLLPDIPIDYVSDIKPGDLKGVRIGVLANYYNHDSQAPDAKATIAKFDQSVERLKSLGAEIIHGVKPQVRNGLSDANYALQLYEFKHGINRYLQSHGSPNGLGSLADLIKYNSNNKVTAIATFGQEIFIEAQSKGAITSKDYTSQYNASHIAARAALDKWFFDQRIDVIVGPTNSPVWKTDLVKGDNWDDFLGSEEYPAIAGYPHLTIPMGLVDKLPVGISFIGPYMSDHRLLQIGYIFEQATKQRAEPQYLPTR